MKAKILTVKISTKSLIRRIVISSLAHYASIHLFRVMLNIIHINTLSLSPVSLCMDGWLEDMYTHIELQWSYNNNHETQLSYKLGSTGARWRKEWMKKEGMNVRGFVRKWGHVWNTFFKLNFNFLKCIVKQKNNLMIFLTYMYTSLPHDTPSEPRHSASEWRRIRWRIFTTCNKYILSFLSLLFFYFRHSPSVSCCPTVKL